MKNVSILFILLFSVLLISCAPSAKFVKYTEQQFEPTNKVQVLNTKPPEKDYIEMGKLSIRVKKQNEDEVILRLKEKAREIGANAMIILGENQKGTVALPMGNAAYGVPIKDLEAVAIRYM